MSGTAPTGPRSGPADGPSSSDKPGAQRQVIHRLAAPFAASSTCGQMRRGRRGVLHSSAALGIAGGSAATDGPASEASGGTCRLCRPTASRSAARDRSEAEGPQDRCCQVPLCPFPLLPPFRHSTAGALAEARNIRGNAPYTLDPYTPSPSAQRVYGSCRFRWIYGLLVVQPFCRPLQRRTDASSAPPRGTSGYPYGSSHVASATSGAARSAPPGGSCCRRRIRPGAQRSTTPRDLSRQAVENSAVTALH